MPAFPEGRHNGTLVPLARVQTRQLRINLLAGTVHCGAHHWPIALSPRELHLLTQDTDWIAATLLQRERIAQFESARLATQPWLAHTLEP